MRINNAVTLQMRSRKCYSFFWDADGTIVNSAKFAYDATNDVLKHFGKRTFTSEEFRELFSSDYRIHLRRMGIKSTPEARFLVNTWNSKLVTDKYKFKLHDGVLDILTYLNRRNYKMALVSSTSRLQLQLYFDMFGIDKFFSAIIAREDVEEQKPSTKPFLQAAERLAVSPRDCIAIDDADDGIEAARKMGAITIGVTWGFNSYQRISNAKPDFIAENPKELERVIVKELKC
jgi:HAD superfamily hydrolase (TIGR01509 family)